MFMRNRGIGTGRFGGPRWCIVPAALAVLLLWTAVGVQAQQPSLHWELAADGGQLIAVAHLDPGEGHYVYGPQPQFTGLPTRLALTRGGQGARILYPPAQPKLDKASGREVMAYTSPTPIFVLLGEQSAPVELEGALRMLSCTDTTCMPVTLAIDQSWGEADLSDLPDAKVQPWWMLLSASSEAGNGQATSVPAQPLPKASADVAGDVAGEAGQAAQWDFDPVFFAADLEVAGLGKAIFFGLLAGLILNVMPCVLPVVGLKISTLLSATGDEDETRRIARFREHNLFFSLGIVLYFAILAGLFGMAGLAWGQLFQRPGVVFALAVAVFLLGLSLFGVMNLPVLDLKGTNAEAGGRTQALLTGMLATLLATPCSGPLLGGVLGWTLWQPPQVVAAVFLAIGLGMSSPYLVLTVRPGLARFFPRPGAWVGYMEKAVAFFLMATCVYLLSILPTAMHVPALVTLLACAFGAWMWGGWTGLARPLGHRVAVRAAAVAVVVLTAWLALAPAPPTSWKPFEPESFSASLGSKRMLVDFTADWCPNCKVLEQVVLTPENLAAWRDGYDLELVQVDMTTMDAQTSALLKSLGSASIPVVAIFPEGVGALRPVVLRDLFTRAQIEAALARTFGD